MTESILIIGAAGSVGHDMLYQIASMGLPIKVIGADIDEEKGKFEVEESLHVAHNLGMYPDITYKKMNLFDIGETSEILKEMKCSQLLEIMEICILPVMAIWEWED